MRRAIVIGLMLQSIFFWALPASGGPDFKEGSWGITMVTEMPGTLRGLPISYKSCITKKNIVPQHTKATCTISDIKQVGNTVSWVVKCEKENVTSEGRVTYAGTTFDGVVNTTTNDGYTMSQLEVRLGGNTLGRANKPILNFVERLAGYTEQSGGDAGHYGSDKKFEK